MTSNPGRSSRVLRRRAGVSIARGFSHNRAARDEREQGHRGRARRAQRDGGGQSRVTRLASFAETSGVGGTSSTGQTTVARQTSVTRGDGVGATGGRRTGDRGTSVARRRRTRATISSSVSPVVVPAEVGAGGGGGAGAGAGGGVRDAAFWVVADTVEGAGAFFSDA